MNIKEYFEKHNNGALQDGEWEHLAQQLINAKFDRELNARWAQQLSEKGIHRKPAMTFSLHQLNVRKFMAAAAVLLLVFTAGWYFFLRSPLSPAQVMASHYLEQPFRLNQGSTRGEESIEQNRGKAYEAFEMEQYEKSLSYLRIVETGGQAKAPDFFQMGLCLMYQKEPDFAKAIVAFQTAQKLDSAAYTDEINWFSGLCYLMKNDNDNAAAALEKVVESPSSRNREAAMELLKKLK